MPPSYARRIVAALLVASVAVLAAGAGVPRPAAFLSLATPVFARTIQDPPASPRQARLAQAAIDWRGGPITASTGETVTVYVSNSLDASVTPENWAEFIAHLTHGAEISKLTTYLATLDEVQQVCGSQALGCYGDDELFAVGQTLTDGTTPEEIVRHEYGHHIAANRTNPPWIAVDWGPKYWASTLDVCSKVQRSQAYPGDEGLHYDQNPGEAWAETYRLMDERKNGILTASWDIVSPNFFPTEAAYQAAERDVLQPWTAGHTTSFNRLFTKKGKKVWLIRLETPTDGNLVVTAKLPKGGLDDVSLVAPNRSTVLKRGFFSGTRTKRIVSGVCGQRSLFVRVTEKGALGRVSVAATTP